MATHPAHAEPSTTIGPQTQPTAADSDPLEPSSRPSWGPGSEPLTREERQRVWVQLDDVFARATRAARELAHATRPPRYEEGLGDDGGGSGVHGAGFEVDIAAHPALSETDAPARVLAIDGLLGVGKTSLCRDLLTRLDQRAPGRTHRMVREPVNNELLAMFYADPDGMAERFQLIQGALCLSSARLAVIESRRPDPQSAGTVLLDRSPLGNLAFALVHYLEGRISEAAFLAYKIQMASAGFLAMPRTVHLYAPPEVVAQRVQERLEHEDPGRACESGIPLRYLQRLDAVMLMVSSYAAAAGHSSVRFVDWSRYGSADAVLDLALDRAETGPYTVETLRRVDGHTKLSRWILTHYASTPSFDPVAPHCDSAPDDPLTQEVRVPA